MTSLSKLLRVKMLLSDINNNRRRVQELFQRIDDAEDNEENIWFDSKKMFSIKL